MLIPPWISSNVLNFETENSRAYISNLKTFGLFWLQKEASDLWYIILNSKNINGVYEYAKKKKLEEEVPHFLYMLEENGLLFSKEENIHNKKTLIFANNQKEKEQENTSFLSQWSQLNIKENKLTRIQFDVTYRCNENCIHCFNDKTMPNVEISFEEIKPIIDDAYELGLTQIVFSGGECTLIKDFLKIAKYIKNKRIEFIFFTNGQKLYDNKDFFEEVVNLYPHYIGLSLYSMEPEIHEKITRVKGSHFKTLKVIEKLKERNVPVEIKCFLTKYNADSYLEVVNFAKENNFRYGLDENLVPNKNYSNFHAQVTDKQQKDLYKYLYKNKLTKFKNVIDEEFLNDFPCISGRTTLDIDPNLNVTSCPTANFNFANLHNISLKELWNSKNSNSPLKKWSNVTRRDFTNCFKFEYCAYCNFCPGKCIDDYTRINVLCRVAKIKMEIAKKYES